MTARLVEALDSGLTRNVACYGGDHLCVHSAEPHPRKGRFSRQAKPLSRTSEAIRLRER
jgi:hypothetical protein